MIALQQMAKFDIDVAGIIHVGANNSAKALKVLQGATELLKTIDGIFVEVSEVTL